MMEFKPTDAAWLLDAVNAELTRLHETFTDADERTMADWFFLAHNLHVGMIKHLVSLTADQPDVAKDLWDRALGLFEHAVIRERAGLGPDSGGPNDGAEGLGE